MAELVSHEEIENAYQPVKEILKRLPEDTTEAKRAADHLKLSEDYAHETRDRTKVDRVTEPVDASVEMRGPAMLGWPFQARMMTGRVWTWTDGSAP